MHCESVFKIAELGWLDDLHVSQPDDHHAIRIWHQRGGHHAGNDIWIAAK